MLFPLVGQTLTFAWVNFFFSGFVAGKFSHLLSTLVSYLLIGVFLPYMNLRSSVMEAIYLLVAMKTDGKYWRNNKTFFDKRNNKAYAWFLLILKRCMIEYLEMFLWKVLEKKEVWIVYIWSIKDMYKDVTTHN